MLRSGYHEFRLHLSSLSRLSLAASNAVVLCEDCQHTIFVSNRCKKKITVTARPFCTVSTNSYKRSGPFEILDSKFLTRWDLKPVRLFSSTNPPPSGDTHPTEDEGKELHDVSEEQQEVEKKKNKLLKMIPRMRKPPSLSYSYTGNIYILPSRALTEYLLKLSDLENLPKYSRRSPYASGDKIMLYLRSDVEEVAMETWGSFERLNKEKAMLRQRDTNGRFDTFHLRSLLGEGSNPDGTNPDDPLARAMAEGKQSADATKEPSFLSSGSAKVVMSAILINGANCLLKFVAWLYSGSHSMFSEFIHSCADTMNQVILGIGLYHSYKKPDTDHPYGYNNLRHISSLISGVGIFFLGTGLSWYHSFQGFMHPTDVGSLTWCIATLIGSFFSEGGTLLIAIHQIQKASKAMDMSFKEYVQSGIDPNVTVVLLEDMAAVLGVGIAGLCISVSHLTGSPAADALGSALIGTLLGGVAGFIIYNNTTHLVGRSIPLDERHEISQLLETDRMIRSLHDIKATQMGGLVRYKAEVDFDGREITRAYLYKQDLDLMLAEANNLQTVEDLENFMLNHGDKIIDTLGAEVDRIEKALKSKHPEIRHVDLEAL